MTAETDGVPEWTRADHDARTDRLRPFADHLRVGFDVPDGARVYRDTWLMIALLADEWFEARLAEVTERAERAEAMHAEAFRIAVENQERLKRVEDYAIQCAILRVEPSTAGLRHALSVPPGQATGDA